MMSEDVVQDDVVQDEAVPADGAAPAEEQAADTEKPSREAKYRTRLREAEADRDQLAGRLEAVQRQHVESMLAGVSPKAFWLLNQLDGLLSEDGTIDPGKVKEAITGVRAELGITTGVVVPQEGQRPSNPPRPGFADAFGPKR